MTCFGENGKHWTAVYRLYHFKLVVTSMRSGGHFACTGASFFVHAACVYNALWDYVYVRVLLLGHPVKCTLMSLPN